MNEIESIKKILMMKSGITYRISVETAERLERQMIQQEKHTFVRINEINATLNTAEMEGITTSDKYEDLQKIKSGKWKCVYEAWHDRKETCNCAEEHRREFEEKKRIEEMKDKMKMPTEEQRKEALARIKKVKEHFLKTGSWK
jgi:hypothetical protein